MKELHPFVTRLYELAARQDHAALAALRRSLAHPTAALPYVAPFLRRNASRREEDALVLVAGLFAVHPAHGPLSLAHALRRCGNASASIELRFRALLDCEAEDLATHLRHAVSLVRGRDLPIDYDDLLRAVIWWGSEAKDRQRRWAREYWASSEPNEETTP